MYFCTLIIFQLFFFLLDIVYNTFSDETYFLHVNGSDGHFLIFKVCIGEILISVLSVRK